MKNQFTLTGNIGQKPELKKSAKGASYLQFSLAVNDDFKPQGATEYTKRTIWFNLVVFGQKAEALVKILDKGIRVKVSGKIQMKKVEDNGPQKGHSHPELVVMQVDLAPLAPKGQASTGSKDPDMSDVFDESEF